MLEVIGIWDLGFFTAVGSWLVPDHSSWGLRSLFRGKRGISAPGNGAPLVVIYSSPYKKANQGDQEHYYGDYDGNESP